MRQVRRCALGCGARRAGGKSRERHDCGEEQRERGGDRAEMPPPQPSPACGGGGGGIRRRSLSGRGFKTRRPRPGGGDPHGSSLDEDAGRRPVYSLLSRVDLRHRGFDRGSPRSCRRSRGSAPTRPAAARNHRQQLVEAETPGAARAIRSMPRRSFGRLASPVNSSDSHRRGTRRHREHQRDPQRGDSVEHRHVEQVADPTPISASNSPTSAADPRTIR